MAADPPPVVELQVNNADPQVEAQWRAVLSGDHQGNNTLRKMRRVFKGLPSNPRCKLCYAPYGAPFGPVLNLLGYGPWDKNPSLCGACMRQLEKDLGGAEVVLTMMFADLRGSTELAERLPAATYRQMVNAFYGVASRHVNDAGGMIDKYLGDGILALFIPGFSGLDHAASAITAGGRILHDTLNVAGIPAEARPLPLGIGVHTGTAYVGVLGRADSLLDFTALGDAVNLTQRLSTAAASRELLISEEARAAAGIATDGLQARELDLKGISRPIRAWLATAEAAVA
ncbi:MAG TPA: adenylate/guanylate cyclase domain-containing protein [Candidatus Limnocylindrales bacterium]|nr:adenylate/guanylate cyclase domain-containing protein [Candidatus Limnocylindrales bacterium]